MARGKFLHMSDLNPGDKVRKRANPKDVGTIVRTGFVQNMVEVKTPQGIRYWHPFDLEIVVAKQ